ncbi:Uncharacterised protein [Mycobacteroides abscessus subsp. abscessus]|uniref:hypothetical protein n=1 Tax=Mycobacteroides abscessus TaxID=36809 RepID=UPI0009A5AC95|nr:hypothetical protein [Mycobacteroides abscessus]MBN7388525.1 hypothetical protein [Mycobacteroides abscessus subsp. abscessus]MBN7414795.1 hypothetical protein [Mycobacteroides abscessus subsp. abscessus]MDO2961055.1 hypothetical protein [Mycobacteroides abscessus subsp. abscessus]MDO2995023.1 hypothetical protein [Mycobacteroides abscessus subsp. abscessus]MDO3064324.1 hypothetical protein [Mycobacteroides abscessus subsp. abscessus]
MTSLLDAATAALHGLIVSARAENPGISADPYGDALALWMLVVHEVREVLSGLETHDDTLGEVEYVYRTAVEAWLRGTVPDGSRVEEALLERIRMALNPPSDLIF